MRSQSAGTFASFLGFEKPIFDEDEIQIRQIAQHLQALFDPICYGPAFGIEAGVDEGSQAGPLLHGEQQRMYPWLVRLPHRLVPGCAIEMCQGWESQTDVFLHQWRHSPQ